MFYSLAKLLHSLVKKICRNTSETVTVWEKKIKSVFVSLIFLKEVERSFLFVITLY